MNCFWCHKPVEGSRIYTDAEIVQHPECASALMSVAYAKYQLDALEQQECARDPNCDPMASAEAQRLLAEYRRLNHLALNKLDTGNRLRLMFGQPLLD